MSVVAESFHGMAQTIDPDVQATLADFLTYTEHFPSHLTRALTLINAETKRADENIALIHADTTAYGALPSLPAAEREDAAAIRKRISRALDDVERAGRMRLAEAVRLADTAAREKARLDILTKKLEQIPLPSRDPTPDDSAALTSPNLNRTARLGVDEVTERLARRVPDRAGSKMRARRITVPGEVLPPPDPDAVLETMSDWSSSRSSPDFEEFMRRKEAAVSRPRSRTPKPPRPDRIDRVERDKKAHRPRGPRLPGLPGTNAHSAVAGISTSNALLALNPPPADAIKGSKWLPWTKLTEWEMATLRKRMKKNAIWVPSATMLRRELKDLGRGVGGREEAKQVALAQGVPFLDEPFDSDPTRVVIMLDAQPEDSSNTLPPGSESLPLVYADEADMEDDEELINRGMRLNEAKKIKRARLVQEQAEAAAQLDREQIELSGRHEPVTDLVPAKKRKRESTPDVKRTIAAMDSPDPLSRAGPPLRKIKLTHTTSNNAEQDSKKASPSVTNHSRSSGRGSDRKKVDLPPLVAANASVRRPTIVLKASRAVNKAVSEEPPNRRASLRRASNASLPSSGTLHVARSGREGTRRSKRPAPGLVTAPDNESARVSASRRKAAPRRKGRSSAASAAANQEAQDAQTEDEMVDPDEPRYCICGDVSWGTMIACDNEISCEKEWFHLDCVGLSELPPRRTKWYCPDCRKKLKQGQSTNGLVGRMA